MVVKIICLLNNVSGSISNEFGPNYIKEVSLKGSVFDFLVDYCFNEESGILSIHKHLMV